MIGRRVLGQRGLPSPLIKGGKSATRLWYRPTAGRRVFPNTLIVGAQRAGTTSLFRYLVRHPAVMGPHLTKGVHYFDTGFEHNPDWYRSHFPTERAVESVGDANGVEPVVLEGSPYYLFHPGVPARIAGALPNTRILIVLRDPIARARSHHKHEQERGFESLDFAAALAAEPERLAGSENRLRRDPLAADFEHQHHSYVARGQYGAQVERYLRYFPSEQVLVVWSEALSSAPAKTMSAVFEFLGLPALETADYPRFNARTYEEPTDEIELWLSDQFRQSDQHLEELVGMALPWRGGALLTGGGSIEPVSHSDSIFASSNPG
ncbi:MAG: sulfotransferase domain-containing protein [Acidimicrobiia bacterium]|nr:sulfotransferase domain-containing protein [Acidimicrobiia bacterium]MBP8179537.1 sulfotransferase domain-containing protein [Acidimicrobiia bacterium]